MRLVKIGLVILLVSPLATAARPQQDSSSGQQESLADAARRSQARKKNQPQAAKVWDNDNIPTNDNTSVVGQANATEGGPTPPAPPESTQKTGGPVTPEQKATIQADLNAAKAELESLKTDLDIAQRKYALDQQTYLSNPNYIDKSGGKALEEEKEQIAVKQQQITEAQKKVDDLQAQADAAANGAK